MYREATAGADVEDTRPWPALRRRGREEMSEFQWDIYAVRHDDRFRARRGTGEQKGELWERFREITRDRSTYLTGTSLMPENDRKGSVSDMATLSCD